MRYNELPSNIIGAARTVQRGERAQRVVRSGKESQHEMKTNKEVKPSFKSSRRGKEKFGYVLMGGHEGQKGGTNQKGPAKKGGGQGEASNLGGFGTGNT